MQILHDVQIEMTIPPSAPNHVVRLIDIENFIFRRHILWGINVPPDGGIVIQWGVDEPAIDAEKVVWGVY